MTTITRWTIDIVETLPQLEGGRYESIDGELYVTHQPHVRHQITCGNMIVALGSRSLATGAGRTIQAPGLIFADDEAVAPDLVWIGRARLSGVIGDDGKLHAAPDLIVEIASPGKANEERDRDKNRALYDRRNVPECWIADWQAMTVDVFRRESGTLQRVATLQPGDVITSPLLPGFSCAIGRFFAI
ncbi:MAG: Uma2 family endonuclease [Roseiflexus sp.]|nr:Uma2 family endonuclease [Roseiflexus sp.]MCS7288895.1 Uma2 family endonuclease [Roseiflexus sp.]MDW8231827.1 Uma2 family endonuclease [Roseiflexaceae bacterium]